MSNKHNLNIDYSRKFKYDTQNLYQMEMQLKTFHQKGALDLSTGRNKDALQIQVYFSVFLLSIYFLIIYVAHMFHKQGHKNIFEYFTAYGHIFS